MSVECSRNELGWKPFFQQQLTLEEWEEAVPARVIQQHRANLELFTESGKVILQLLPKMPQLTVGDWLLLDHDGAFIRLLDRFSLFSRRAAGTKVAEQLIAANLDTIFIVLSLNEDFNLNRIERYLSLAHEAQVEPVVVLTKADLCPETDAYKNQVQNLD
ncbi:MAG: GTPase RsgA, partial [Desulfuromusa sp.]|nr:GTPase RsgA [Desulfuromusa sp.]